ncbi:MAG: type II secretion system protein [Clostridium sp.]
MKKKGFTLVELLVVIAMMGILLAISVPGFVQSVNKSKEMERVKHEEMINTSLRQYYAIELKYPVSGVQSELDNELKKLEDLKYIKLENIYKYEVGNENLPIIKVKFK